MCGIAGIFRTRSADDAHTVRAMCAKLVHRGPDDSGLWNDPRAGITIGHRRLAVLDLSDAAAQPMVSASKRYVLSVNGEIYNYRELASTLQTPLRGTGDTEVLLALIDEHGVDEALRRVNGMFALAVFDTQERQLHLVRDRIGIKPLYVAEFSGGVAFASELGALSACPDVSSAVCPQAVSAYLRHGFVPAPLGMFLRTSKLMPAEHLVVRADGAISSRRFWHVPPHTPQERPDEEALDQLRSLLADAVRLRTASDVPLGSFLSGGIDSALITATLARVSPSRVSTFCVGFEDTAFDEAPIARAIAAHLGTDHTEVRLTPLDVQAAIPSLPKIYSEPFADSSQLATLLVCQTASQRMTVALSGDGGDELFGGYDRYLWGRRVYRTLRRAPQLAALGAGAALARIAPRTVDRLYAQVESALPSRLRVRHPGHKMGKFVRLMRARSIAEFYEELACIDASTGTRAPMDDSFQSTSPEDLVSYMSHRDIAEHLPDDMLTKVDRASMSASLEVRVPMLDHRLVEFSRTLTHNQWMRDGRGKWALAQLLDADVPAAIRRAPKATFSIPLADWLRGPLKDWGADLLAAPQVDYVDWAPARALWAEHQAGTALHTERLWSYLVLEAWDRERR